MVSDPLAKKDDDSVRINDLARGLGVRAALVVEYLPAIGITEKKTHSSAIHRSAAEKVRKHFLELAKLASSSGVRPSDSIRAHIDANAVESGRSTSTQSTNSRVAEPPVVLTLPTKFSFVRRFVDFDSVLGHFDWSLKHVPVTVDLTHCESSNFQALALLVQYLWHLTINGCEITVKYGPASLGSTKMLGKMGAREWLQVLLNDGKNFGYEPGRTMALRRRSDVQNAISTARTAIRNYKVGFPDYLSYIVSELLYNATEHGARRETFDGCQVIVPSIFQFGQYPASEKLVFFFSDLGIGVKAHLERAYPPFPTHQEAIVQALRPNVSGTFNQSLSPYSSNNNAGMGLTYSNLMLKRLKGDMYIVSHTGMAHVSPEDVTTRNLRHPWPGTFVLVNLDVSEAPELNLQDLLREIRGKAETERNEAESNEQTERFYVNIQNHFGKWAEDKDAAISFREKRLLPAIQSGKKIEMDFKNVETAPHSFLNALLATPIQRLGIKAYQWIRIHNASGSIHEIVRTIFDANLPRID